MLTAHAETPVVAEAAVSADLLQSLQVLTQLAVHAVGQDLTVFAIYDIALSVEEP
jgi:hypothetical protein